MERSFEREIALLRRGAGESFEGEGILAITKALLQSGVAYVGGYQGAPVSHLLDVLVQAEDLLAELGVDVQACANEAAAAALLAASIHYPVRGAVTWKSIVGTNVASDALSNLASTGVTGGALIVVGEDYGEGASVIQERTLAFALKSSLCLIDPRPDHGVMTDLVERAFELSEASSIPVMMQLRIRACHLRGSFVARDNVAPPISIRAPLAAPARFDYARLSHPPATFAQEKLKSGERLDAARRYIVEHAMNELRGGAYEHVGLIVQGGLFNALIAALQQLGAADAFGQCSLPILVLNVTCPLVPDQIGAFAAGKSALLIIEEGQPEFLENEIHAILARRSLAPQVHGKDLLAMAGEYNVELLCSGLAEFARRHLPELNVAPARAWLTENAARRARVAAELGALPGRPPSFCIGCPERPVFAALKLLQEEIGPLHIAADIGCHAFATFEPFSSGHSILGYGMSLASAVGVAPFMKHRPLAIMGDGGFWHNGLLSGVQSALFNGDDAVLLILKNGYTSATGTQEILSSPDGEVREVQRAGPSALAANQTIERALEGMGVRWQRVVSTYDVGSVLRVLGEAFSSDFNGLKVIIGEGECQLERQRRVKPEIAARLSDGRRVARARYGVDANVCSGDHSCMRLSGCPTLSLADANDGLKVDPVATVLDGCVGCGLCGENAHAATLCPSFYRVDIVENPTAWERLGARLAQTWTQWFAPV